MKTGPRHTDLSAAVEIARLAFGHLRTHPGLSYAPDIGLEQRIAARLLHDRHPVAPDPLLAVYDGTLLATAAVGFVVTAARFCWRRRWSAPRQLEWARVRPSPVSSVSTVEGPVVVDGDELPVPDQLAAGLRGFLEEMAARQQVPEAGPYRVAGPTESLTAAVDMITRVTWETLGAMHGLVYYPFISATQLARSRLAMRVPATEDVAVLYEDAFEGRPRGFLFTPARLYWHRGDGRSASVAWRDALGVRVERPWVFVDDEQLPWGLMLGARADLPRAMGQLLVMLAERARSGELG
jgi:hypothetical protein